MLLGLLRWKWIIILKWMLNVQKEGLVNPTIVTQDMIDELQTSVNMVLNLLFP